ncbi:MAG TPA: 50S ribosomal protein L1 [Actinomycetota bacterium]|nr:50S ribosomal protein L1 [Actinomycetota bacterium]
MSHQGKRYAKAMKGYDREKFYSAGEALTLARSLSSAKFDETIELSLRLGVDPRKADQIVRGSVSLPRGTGKTVRVAVFAQGEQAREATEAGAEIVGGQELADRVQKGFTDFDVAIATPDMMPVVGKLGKILGPRGLMPNPKSGTVSADVSKAVREVKAGKIEYRTDRQANIHTVIGKSSFDGQALADNYLAVVDEVVRAKPSAAKGKYIKSATVASTMGPGIRIDTARLRELAADGAAAGG